MAWARLQKSSRHSGCHLSDGIGRQLILQRILVLNAIVIAFYAGRKRGIYRQIKRRNVFNVGLVAITTQNAQSAI